MKGLKLYITQEDLDKYIKSKVVNDDCEGICFVPTSVAINADYSIDITLIAAVDDFENNDKRYKYTFEEDPSIDDSCMAANTGGYVWTTSTKLPETSTLTTDRIAEAVERTKKYLR